MLLKLVKSSLCLTLAFAAIAPIHAADTPKKRDITLDDLANDCGRRSMLLQSQNELL